MSNEPASSSSSSRGQSRPPGLILVLDANDPPTIAEFWAAALHYDRQQPLAHFEILTPP